MAMHSVIEINRPVEPVFGFFLDLEQNIVRTDPKVESVVKVTEGPLRAGTTFRIRQPVMGSMRQQTMRVTGVEPNRRIDMEAAFGPVRPRFSLTFEPTAQRDTGDDARRLPAGGPIQARPVPDGSHRAAELGSAPRTDEEPSSKVSAIPISGAQAG